MKKRNFKPKTCERCGDVFKPTGGHAKYCCDCSIEVSREKQLDCVRKHYKKNREKMLEYHRKYKSSKRDSKMFFRTLAMTSTIADSK